MDSSDSNFLNVFVFSGPKFICILDSGKVIVSHKNPLPACSRDSSEEAHSLLKGNLCFFLEYHMSLPHAGSQCYPSLPNWPARMSFKAQFTQSMLLLHSGFFAHFQDNISFFPDTPCQILFPFDMRDCYEHISQSRLVCLSFFFHLLGSCLTLMYEIRANSDSISSGYANDISWNLLLFELCHEKMCLKIVVVVIIPKEGLAGGALPILPCV